MSAPFKRLSLAICLAVAVGLLLGACASSDKAAQESYELGQFEERQGNVDHAKDLYRGIIARYPGTGWAEKAQARLESLQAPPAPPPALPAP